MGKTKIEWTDMSWPVVTGCSPVSAGCRNCYAARMAATRLRYHPRYAGLAVMQAGMPRWTGEVRLNHDVLEQPLHWKKPRRIFVAPMGDLFHEDVPFRFMDHVFHTVELARQHTFQILTKRPKRMLEYMASRSADFPLSNACLGVSVESPDYLWRIGELMQCPAAVRFVSLEPLLAGLSLEHYLGIFTDGSYSPHQKLRVGVPPVPNLFTCTAKPTNSVVYKRQLDWVVVGGESGPGARPMHPQWARDIRDQCQAASVSFFMKQMSKKSTIPDDLMVREYPK